jgi:hypothetical protein
MQNGAEAGRTAKKYFTVESANKMLPLVRSIATDIVTKFRELDELRGRLEIVHGGRREGLSDAHREEVDAIEQEFDRVKGEFGALADELRRLGVELKGPDGLVDFPAIMDDREVYLCWKLGEPEVLYWHEREAGFAGRQRLEVAVSADAEKGS